MKNKKIILFIITYLLCNPIIFAAYFVSDEPIANNYEAQTQCVTTCQQNMANWTGSWWSVSDDTSLCECFYSWPYCPKINEPPPVLPCYPLP